MYTYINIYFLLICDGRKKLERAADAESRFLRSESVDQLLNSTGEIARALFSSRNCFYHPKWSNGIRNSAVSGEEQHDVNATNHH